MLISNVFLMSDTSLEDIIGLYFVDDVEYSGPRVLAQAMNHPAK